MKTCSNLFFVFILTLFFSACSNKAGATKVEGPEPEWIQFEIEEIQNPQQHRKLLQVLTEIPGLSDVIIAPDASRGALVIDPDILSREELIQVFEKEGFSVHIL